MGRLSADFGGDVALVTGGAAGIGRAIASALFEAGARVHVFDPSAEPPADLGAAEDTGPSLLHHAVDVRDGAAVQAAVRELVEREGSLDLLVNNAGLTRDRALWKMDDEEWAAVLDVNLSGTFHVLRAVAPHMRAREHGRIVQIASINGLRGRFGQANYSAAKAGLIGLTRTAARELGPRGITVNAVAPGWIETAMTAQLPAEARERSLSEAALRRLGRPEDVVAAVLFLLSEQAAHVTGVTLAVDGGQLA